MLGAAIFSLQVHFIVDYMHLCFFKKKKIQFHIWNEIFIKSKKSEGNYLIGSTTGSFPFSSRLRSGNESPCSAILTQVTDEILY